MQELRNKLKGTGVAIVTPFTASGAIDFPSFEKVLEHTLQGGVEYIVLMGTTGESATLSKPEKKSLLDFTIEKLNRRVPLILGIGGNNTSEVVLAIHGTSFKGVDGVLSVSPYYNKPSQEGIYQHFKILAESCPVPVILYTVPGRTGSNISASTTLRLAHDIKTIIGIKEASGNLDQIGAVLKDRPDGFLVISGDDGLTLPLLAMGADGVISVVANVCPKEFSEMVRLGLQGNFEEARKIHFKLIDLIHGIFMDGSPGGVKAAMQLRQLCDNYLRLPLVPVNMETYKLIQKLITEIE